MKALQFFAWHGIGWAILYMAFFEQMEGAMYILKFYVWLMAPLSLFLLMDGAVQKSAKQRPYPILAALQSVQAWSTLALLVWFGHIATALAYALLMLMISMHRDATKKSRQESTP